MQPDSFGIFFKLKNGPFLFKIIAVAVVGSAFAVYKGYNAGYVDESLLIAMIIGIILVIDLVFFVFFMLPYLGYKRALQSHSKLTEEWKQFISRRSQEFFNAKRFVSVSLTIQPALNATQTHRDIVDKFLKQWEDESESLRTRSWKRGSLEKFEASRFSIAGHVAIGGGINLLLRKIFSELPRLLKTVENQIDVSLSFGNERSFEKNVAVDVLDKASPGNSKENGTNVKL